MVKNPFAMLETWVRPLGREEPLEEDMATHSSILAWRIPMDGGARGHRVRRDWATKHGTITYYHQGNPWTKEYWHMKGLPYTSHNFFEMVVPAYISFTRLQQGLSHHLMKNTMFRCCSRLKGKKRAVWLGNKYWDLQLWASEWSCLVVSYSLRPHGL